MRLSVFALAVLAAACSGPSKVDVTGTWDITQEYTACESTGGDNRGCGYLRSVPPRMVVTLLQSGSTVTGTIQYLPAHLSGTLGGDTVRVTGSGTDPATGNTDSEQWDVRVTDDDRMTGTRAHVESGPDIGGGTWTLSAKANVRMVRR